MLVTYFEDIRKDFEYTLNEIVMHGPLWLVGDPISQFEASTKGYIDKKVSEIDVSSITDGKIKEEVFPEFTGDIFNIKGFNYFNLREVGKVGRLFNLVLDSKGRVIDGVTTIAPTPSEIGEIPFSNLVYDKYTKLGDTRNPGMSYKDFVNNINDGVRYLRAYDKNTITQPFAILSHSGTPDAILNEEMVEEEIDVRYGDKDSGIKKDGDDGHNDWSKKLCSIVDHSGRPWAHQRNTSIFSWTLTSDSTPILRTISNDNNQYFRGNMIVTKDKLMDIGLNGKVVYFDLTKPWTSVEGNEVLVDFNNSYIGSSDFINIVMRNDTLYYISEDSNDLTMYNVIKIDLATGLPLSTPVSSSVPEIGEGTKKLAFLNDCLYVFNTTTGKFAYAKQANNGNMIGGWTYNSSLNQLPTGDGIFNYSDIARIGDYLYLFPGEVIDTNVNNGSELTPLNSVIYRIRIENDSDLVGIWEEVKLEIPVPFGRKATYITSRAIYLFNYTKASGINVYSSPLDSSGNIEGFEPLLIGKMTQISDSFDKGISVASTKDNLIVMFGKSFYYIPLLEENGKNDYLYVVKSDYVPDGICEGLDGSGPLFVEYNLVGGEAWSQQQDFTPFEIRALENTHNSNTDIKTSSAGVVYKGRVIYFTPSETTAFEQNGITYVVKPDGKFTLSESIPHNNTSHPKIPDFIPSPRTKAFIVNDMVFITDSNVTEESLTKANSYVNFAQLTPTGTINGGWRRSFPIPNLSAGDDIVFEVIATSLYVFNLTKGTVHSAAFLRDGGLYPWATPSNITPLRVSGSKGSAVLRTEEYLYIISSNGKTIYQAKRQSHLLAEYGAWETKDKIDTYNGYKSVVSVAGNIYEITHVNGTIVIASTAIRQDSVLGNFEVLEAISTNEETFIEGPTSVLTTNNNLHIGLGNRVYTFGFKVGKNDYTKELDVRFTKDLEITQYKEWTSNVNIGISKNVMSTTPWKNTSHNNDNTVGINKDSLKVLFSDLSLGDYFDSYVNQDQIGILDLKNSIPSSRYNLDINGDVDVEVDGEFGNYFPELPYDGRYPLNVIEDLNKPNQPVYLRLGKKDDTTSKVVSLWSLNVNEYALGSEEGWVNLGDLPIEIEDGNDLHFELLVDKAVVFDFTTGKIFTASRVGNGFKPWTETSDETLHVKGLEDYRDNTIFRLGHYIYVIPGYHKDALTSMQNHESLRNTFYYRLAISNDVILNSWVRITSVTNKYISTGYKEVVVNKDKVIIFNLDPLLRTIGYEAFEVDSDYRLYDKSEFTQLTSTVTDEKGMSTSLAQDTIYLTTNKRLMSVKGGSGKNTYIGNKVKIMEVDDIGMRPWKNQRTLTKKGILVGTEGRSTLMNVDHGSYTNIYIDRDKLIINSDSVQTPTKTGFFYNLNVDGTTDYKPLNIDQPLVPSDLLPTAGKVMFLADKGLIRLYITNTTEVSNFGYIIADIDNEGYTTPNTPWKISPSNTSIPIFTNGTIHTEINIDDYIYDLNVTNGSIYRAIVNGVNIGEFEKVNKPIPLNQGTIKHTTFMVVGNYLYILSLSNINNVDYARIRILNGDLVGDWEYGNFSSPNLTYFSPSDTFFTRDYIYYLNNKLSGTNIVERTLYRQRINRDFTLGEIVFHANIPTLKKDYSNYYQSRSSVAITKNHLYIVNSKEITVFDFDGGENNYRPYFDENLNETSGKPWLYQRSFSKAGNLVGNTFKEVLNFPNELVNQGNLIVNHNKLMFIPFADNNAKIKYLDLNGDGSFKNKILLNMDIPSFNGEFYNESDGYSFSSLFYGNKEDIYLYGMYKDANPHRLKILSNRTKIEDGTSYIKEWDAVLDTTIIKAINHNMIIRMSGGQHTYIFKMVDGNEVYRLDLITGELVLKPELTLPNNFVGGSISFTRIGRYIYYLPGLTDPITGKNDVWSKTGLRIRIVDEELVGKWETYDLGRTLPPGDKITFTTKDNLYFFNINKDSNGTYIKRNQLYRFSIQGDYSIKYEEIIFDLTFPEHRHEDQLSGMAIAGNKLYFVMAKKLYEMEFNGGYIDYTPFLEDPIDESYGTPWRYQRNVTKSGNLLGTEIKEVIPPTTGRFFGFYPGGYVDRGRIVVLGGSGDNFFNERRMGAFNIGPEVNVNNVTGNILPDLDMYGTTASNRKAFMRGNKLYPYVRRKENEKMSIYETELNNEGFSKGQMTLVGDVHEDYTHTNSLDNNLLFGDYLLFVDFNGVITARNINTKEYKVLKIPNGPKYTIFEHSTLLGIGEFIYLFNLANDKNSYYRCRLTTNLEIKEVWKKLPLDNPSNIDYYFWSTLMTKDYIYLFTTKIERIKINKDKTLGKLENYLTIPEDFYSSKDEGSDFYPAITKDKLYLVGSTSILSIDFDGGENNYRPYTYEPDNETSGKPWLYQKDFSKSGDLLGKVVTEVPNIRDKFNFDKTVMFANNGLLTFMDPSNDGNVYAPLSFNVLPNGDLESIEGERNSLISPISIYGSVGGKLYPFFLNDRNIGLSGKGISNSKESILIASQEIDDDYGTSIPGIDWSQVSSINADNIGESSLIRMSGGKTAVFIDSITGKMYESNLVNGNTYENNNFILPTNYRSDKVSFVRIGDRIYYIPGLKDPASNTNLASSKGVYVSLMVERVTGNWEEFDYGITMIPGSSQSIVTKDYLYIVKFEINTTTLNHTGKMVIYRFTINEDYTLSNPITHLTHQFTLENKGVGEDGKDIIIYHEPSIAISGGKLYITGSNTLYTIPYNGDVINYSPYLEKEINDDQDRPWVHQRYNGTLGDVLGKEITKEDLGTVNYGDNPEVYVDRDNLVIIPGVGSTYSNAIRYSLGTNGVVDKGSIENNVLGELPTGLPTNSTSSVILNNQSLDVYSRIDSTGSESTGYKVMPYSNGLMNSGFTLNYNWDNEEEAIDIVTNDNIYFLDRDITVTIDVESGKVYSNKSDKNDEESEI